MVKSVHGPPIRIGRHSWSTSLRRFGQHPPRICSRTRRIPRARRGLCRCRRTNTARISYAGKSIVGCLSQVGGCADEWEARDSSQQISQGLDSTFAADNTKRHRFFGYKVYLERSASVARNTCTGESSSCALKHQHAPIAFRRSMFQATVKSVCELLRTGNLCLS